MQEKGMIYVLGRTEVSDKSFHHTTQNSQKFKIYELFISIISI
jgi:hypothetical protein